MFKELLAREQAVHLSFSSSHTKQRVSKTDPSLILGQFGPSRPTARNQVPKKQDEEVESSFSIKDIGHRHNV